MGILSTSDPLAFTFGLLGNIINLVVLLSPLPTFIRIIKKKSTEGFDSLPYLLSLFTCMLWICYASQKNVFLVITINGCGCVIQSLYIALYITYAPKQPKKNTLRLLFLMNFGAFSVILLLTYFLTQGPIRIKVLGWICVISSTCVFASPLSVLRRIIRTKSVEFMPFPLCFAFTVSSAIWLVYGISLRDLYVALPNAFGIIFGMVQMTIYVLYKYCKTTKVEQPKIQGEIVEVTMNEIVIAEIKPDWNEENDKKDSSICNQTNAADNNLEVIPGSRAIECVA